MDAIDEISMSSLGVWYPSEPQLGPIDESLPPEKLDSIKDARPSPGLA